MEDRDPRTDTDRAESGAWQPLLGGETAERAWQTIHEVAAALAGWPAAIGRDPGLGNGTAGVALFFSYLAVATADDDIADLALELLDRMIDAMSTMPAKPGLYGGYVGPAWTLEHLEGRLLESADQPGEATREIDEALLGLLGRKSWSEEYDLISGLTGFGVYALEVLPRPAGRRCLELLLDKLARLAEPGPDGVSWFTPPQQLPDHQRRQFPRGYYNLGVAHGVPAVVALLGRIHAAGTELGQSRELLDPAVSWILAHQLAPEAEACFPGFVADGADPQPARLAWCYGDLGVAAALLAAARAVGRADWERQALRIARRAATRDEDSSGIRDAGLCHGAAGLGHVFNRLYQATGDPTMAAAAGFWLRRTLEMRRPGAGVAGYLAWWTPDGGTDAEWMPVPGFLMGAAGIGLALLAAVSPIEPDWDRVLMTSIPPAAGRSPGGG